MNCADLNLFSPACGGGKQENLPCASPPPREGGTLEYAIVRVDRTNYPLFDHAVFQRVNGRERTEHERAEVQNVDTIYKALGNENLFVFAASTEDQFVGWISLVYMPKIGRTNGKGYLFIDELWVAPAYRRKGIAHALMAKAEALSKEMNTLGIRLYVNTANHEAISLYQTCGYTKQGEAFFMEKEREE